MPRLIALIAFCALFGAPELWANNFNLISVDSSRWPEVDVVAALPDGNVNANDYALRLAADDTMLPAAYVAGPLPSDPMSMVVAFDTCQSMPPAHLDSAKHALMEYVDYLDANERMAVLAFNESIELESGFMADRRFFKSVLDDITPTQKQTRLYLNLLYTIDLLKDMPGRRHLLVVADGTDLDDELAMGEVLQSARENNVKIFTVALDSLRGGEYIENVAGLEKLATETEGFYYRAKTSEDVESGVYGLLDQQRSLARGERRHLYKIRFNLADAVPQGLMNADLVRADGRDIRYVNFYLPRPRSASAVWNAPGKLTMGYKAYQAVSAATPTGESGTRLWNKALFWLLPIILLGLGYWLWRKYWRPL